MSEHSTVFGIDSHARTTTVCAIVVETGETATRTFPGVSPYGNDGWVQPASSSTFSACGAAMVKRRTPTWPSVSQGRRRSSHGPSRCTSGGHAEYFGTAGQSSLSGGRACGCGIMACRTLAVADPLRLATRKACLP